MAKPKYNRRAGVTRMDALRLHAEANKSDPFAAKRMAMTLARDGYKEIKEVAAESKRILDARDAATAKAFAAWKASQTTGDDLMVLDPKLAPSMSMFKNRADFDVAVAA